MIPPMMYVRDFHVCHGPKTDQVCQQFMFRLKKHLWRRLQGADAEYQTTEPTVDDAAKVRIMHDLMFTHKTLRINYDTYDMRRDQDCINPDSHPDIMLLAAEGAAHPFYYARTVAILHVYALLSDGPVISPQWQEFHVCYVRWFEIDTPAIKPRRLLPLRWASPGEEPFGFVNPDDILRGCHLIPGFAHGRSDDALQGYSGIRFEDDEDDYDWNRHYVNRYAQRHRTTFIINVCSLLDSSTVTCSCGIWAVRLATVANTPPLRPASPRLG